MWVWTNRAAAFQALAESENASWSLHTGVLTVESVDGVVLFGVVDIEPSLSFSDFARVLVHEPFQAISL